MVYPNLFSEHGLSLERLHALLEVAVAGSIAKAAPGDATRQSQYSRQIKELEQFFGAALMRKRGRVLTPTAEGNQLIAMVNSMFCALDDFKCRAAGTPYRYTIGCGDSIHTWMVAPAMARFAAEKPQRQFAFVNLRNADVSKALLDMDIDLGILRTSALSAELLEHRRLARVRYALYVPRALMPRPRSASWVLSHLPVATLGSGASFHDSLMNCLRCHGVELANLNGTQSFPFAARLLETGCYAAILPDIAEKHLPAGTIRVDDPLFDPLAREISLAWNPRLFRVRPAAEQVIRAFLHELGTPL